MRHITKLVTKTWVMPVVIAALLFGTGSAYALFSSTISFGGINMSVGTSALQVQLPDGNWVSDDWTAGYVMTGLYPGLSQSADFQLKNSSTAPLSLDVSAQLVSVEGDWDILKDAVTVRIRDAANSHYSTGFKTLDAWHADGGIGLPGSALDQGETRHYTLDVEIDKDYGNELAGTQLHDLHILLTGVQDD